MKKVLTLILWILTLVGLYGCNLKEKVAPLVSAGYVAVNNTIGFVRGAASDPNIIAEKVDLLLTAATTISKTLQLLTVYIDKPYVGQAYQVSVEIVAVLTEIKNNPELVTDKIAVLLAKLEQVRMVFVTINDKLSLGIVFPDPKSLVSEEELIISVEALKVENEKAVQ
jgi:hypothetical protein